MKIKIYQTESLERTLSHIRTAELDQLRDVEYVANIIRSAGLSFDPRNLYGEDNIHMNPSRWGLWQCPRQLAPLLVELSTHRILSWCEIGTFKGWTTTIMAAYLKRFQNDLVTLTIDPVNHQKDCTEWNNLNISYHQGTADDYSGKVFDFVFIDGDHSYESVKSDYQALGKNARVCVFHDINEELCQDVRRFWREISSPLKESANWLVREYISHSENRNIMGLGLITQIQLPEQAY